MDNYQSAGGDLTDVIVRVGAPPSSNLAVEALPSSSFKVGWGEMASISCGSNVVIGEDFGDPFSDTGDPLLSDRDAPSPFTPPFIDGCTERIEVQSSRGVFSRLLQISSAPSETSPLVVADGVPKYSGDFNYTNSPSLIASTMTEELGVGGRMVRIPSPQNNLGMKRRKSVGKRVVCIPAAAATNNSRPSSGEVVPSDLWAWRKYGQKPIKGSPFPRGYYRCSSSKGCSARKQVERSRTDPNMLVITYTSEHNHPWPSQRNALAGSTRSNSKGSSGSKNSANSSRNAKSGIVKGEERNGNYSDDNLSSTAMAASVKEEMGDVEKKPLDAGEAEFVGVGLAHCYQPSLMDGSDHHPDDFFADLGEIESDPYELLFKRGFLGGNTQNRGNKSLDPFNLLDWADENNGASFYGEANNNMFGSRNDYSAEWNSFT